jgi:hypothetical protein
MQIDGETTRLSPSDADFIEGDFLFSPTGTADRAILDAIHNATDAWARETLSSVYEQKSGVEWYTLRRVQAKSVWERAGGESMPIVVQLTEEQLTRIKEKATMAVHETADAASHVNENHELAIHLGEIMVPDLLPKGIQLSENDKEILKASEFGELLDSVAVGHHIIAVITAHQVM